MRLEALIQTRQAHHKMVNDAAEAFDANPNHHNASLLIAAIDVLGHTTNHIVRALDVERRFGLPAPHVIAIAER